MLCFTLRALSNRPTRKPITLPICSGHWVAFLDVVLQMEKRPKVVLASSSAVYGLTKSTRPVTERSPLRPITEYAVSKVAQETAALRYHYAFGLDVVIVRMFNLLGPGQSPDLACSAFARQIVLAEISEQTEIVTGNLDAKRDFVDVRDAARAFALLAEKGEAGQTYNVCSGNAVAIQQCLSEMMLRSKKKLSARVDAARVQKKRCACAGWKFPEVVQGCELESAHSSKWFSRLAQRLA